MQPKSIWNLSLKIEYLYNFVCFFLNNMTGLITVDISKILSHVFCLTFLRQICSMLLRLYFRTLLCVNKQEFRYLRWNINRFVSPINQATGPELMTSATDLIKLLCWESVKIWLLLERTHSSYFSNYSWAARPEPASCILLSCISL